MEKDMDIFKVSFIIYFMVSAVTKAIYKFHFILKLLYETNNDIQKFEYFVFHIGTNCDSKRLRTTLSFLNEKLIKNMMAQKESILKYVKMYAHICFIL